MKLQPESKKELLRIASICLKHDVLILSLIHT